MFVAPAAHAGSPTQHLAFSYDEESAVSTVDGLPGCPDLVGTLTENRHLDAVGWIKPDGTAHAVTTVTASLTLAAQDGTRPSYVGGYVQQQTGQFTAYGDDERVVTATTHGNLVGSDGSSYRISEVTHLAIDGAGRAPVWFDRLRCEPAA
jgi:hypothetical protein